MDEEKVPPTLLERGKMEVEEEIGEHTTQRLIERTGVRGLTYLIAEVLDEHYPADVFGDGSIVVPSWMDDHGGTSFDPGVRWVALLRQAIKEIT